MNRIRFGANYIPSKSWLHRWVDWDAAAVEEDLLAAKELGVDHIRALPLWPYFQIDPAAMSPLCMRHLESFCEICEKVGMDYCIALFTGFMSGQFFFPSWLKKLSGAYGTGMFTDPQIEKAEEFYLRSIASVVAGRPGFLGFDLGNELSCVASGDPAAENAQCDAWNQRMLALCEEVAPGKLHNNGVDHQPWFNENTFTRRALANTGAVSALHCYAFFTGALERFGQGSEESIHLAPFMAELATAYAEDPNRPCWIQEFGTASDVFNAQMEQFITRSMQAMYTTSNLWGVTWWCTHNVSSEFKAFDALEYHLGLLDGDNRPTPSGRLFQELVKSYRQNPPAPPRRRKALIFEPCGEEGRISSDATWRNGHRYAELVRKGIYPAFVLPERARDASYLKARGIEEIIAF